MKHLLITSMLALSVGCGAAMAQSAQTGGDSNCASGQTDCQKGGKAGEQVQGKAKAGVQAQGKAGANTQEQAQGKAKVKTDQQAQGQAGTDQNAQDNTQLKKKQQAQGKAKNGTEQNAQGSTKMQTNQQAQGQAGTDQNAQDNTQLKKKQQAQGSTKAQTNEQAQGKAGTNTEQNAQGNVDQNSKTASINNVTVEQKTQVTQIIHETKVEPVRDVNFDISVGIEVPRQRIHLHRLPSRIVKIVPAYEGYEYFVLADGRIVIVDPDSYRIVLILT
ncbi:DUF1236 domain-containing protein [Mesorhizobium sp.]|uniref:DUF1236 domain-containing protein n=1 Tax=Mesorhizobium sp. TaxID=1871066 RepID=UPI0025E27F82|nr:DUF1236 domain-containing protein [Mesorhizobium sp.]